MMMVKARRREIHDTDTGPDYGPSIGHQTIHIGARVNDNGTEVEAAYQREARISVIAHADPDRPDRRSDINSGVTWLPLKLYWCDRPELTTAQIIVATRYKDFLDLSMGISDGRQSGGQTPPWARTGITVSMLSARMVLASAKAQLGREVIGIVETFVNAETLLEAAMGMGVGRNRVGRTAASALDKLDAWWAGAMTQDQGVARRA